MQSYNITLDTSMLKNQIPKALALSAAVVQKLQIKISIFSFPPFAGPGASTGSA
jgi:hypothetical protein